MQMIESNRKFSSHGSDAIICCRQRDLLPRDDVCELAVLNRVPKTDSDVQRPVVVAP